MSYLFSDVLEAFSVNTIDFNISTGIGVQVSGKILDGTADFGPISGVLMMNYVPRRSGKIGMIAMATDNTGKSQKATKTLYVCVNILQTDL